jgi:hypothetical protein
LRLRRVPPTAKIRIAKTKVRSLVISAVASRERSSSFPGDVPDNNPAARTYTWIAVQIIAGPHAKREDLYASFGCGLGQNCNPENEARLNLAGSRSSPMEPDRDLRTASDLTSL